MTGLVEFFLACVAKDEEVAQKACEYGSEEWHLDDLKETVLWWPPEPHVVETERKHGMRVTSDKWRGEIVGTDRAPHIARWDPARVLEQCRANRRLVQLYQDAVRQYEAGYHERYQVGAETRLRALEAVIRAVVQPYAGQDGWREEWRG